MRAWLFTLGLVAIAGCTARAPEAEGDLTVVLPDGGPGEVCGDRVCGYGEVCCNPSCGICAKPNGFCTQQLCDVPPPQLQGDMDGDMDGDGDVDDAPGQHPPIDPPIDAEADDFDYANPWRI